MYFSVLKGKKLMLGDSSNQTPINLRGLATCLLHGATGLY